MNLQHRVNLLSRLGEYILSGNEHWKAAVEKAYRHNNWFIPSFIEHAAHNIAQHFLSKEKLAGWTEQNSIPAENKSPKNIGIVMAGNIPMVGFHDFLCTFITGHRQTIKASSKDEILLQHLVQQLWQWDASTQQVIQFAGMLKGCDAYIATGSNNSARYFEYYFNRFPHIIRRNRTSVAILNGQETKQELEQLADDVYLYFGLGCRNVTKLYVPPGYDFLPLLEAFNKYNDLMEHHKYKNNYDYGLAILILNKEMYMTNGSVLISENKLPFSGIARLHYEQYEDEQAALQQIKNSEDIQCIIGKSHTPFGKAQQPGLADYADGIDTLQFLRNL